MKRALALGVLALFFAAACDSAEAKDARVVLEAIRRFRKAETDDMPPLVEALKATECKFEGSCKAKAECLKTGEPTARAIVLKAKAERALAVEGGKVDAEGLIKSLDEASALAKEGQAAIPACDEAVEALKRRYSLY